MYDDTVSSPNWKNRCQFLISKIDVLLSKQVNEIIHHPDFQALESSWRGLDYLLCHTLAVDNLKIRILHVTARELASDLSNAIEFDQSQLFSKIYTNEFDQPGGEPFGLLLGDFYLSHRGGASKKVMDLETLRGVTKVAAAAFTPFVLSADPSFFGLDSFTELQPTVNLGRVFVQKEYLRWKAYREEEDTRFAGVLLPRVLMRLPYRVDSNREDGFCFEEKISRSGKMSFLWGSPIYAFAFVVSRSFEQCGWFADIVGSRQDNFDGGMVMGLARDNFSIDFSGFFNKPATEVSISQTQEKLLSDLGFIPLCECKYTQMNVFYSTQSAQRPKLYKKAAALNNAKLSAKLNYILCVSRFAHYIKILFRNKVGSFANKEECENYLNTWLRQYTAAGEDLLLEMRANYPLRESNVQIRENRGKPGSYYCILHLSPQYQFEQLDFKLSLKTSL